MEAGKLLATRILSNLGFHVEEIPVGAGRTADLRITDDASIYHLEIKEKFEAEALANVRTDCLARGEVYEQADELAHDNRISGILYDAGKQLDKTPKDAGTFQLIWFHADGIDSDLKYRQAFATFYGQVQLIALEPLHSEIKHCFYFDYSAAFAMPTVEALILTDSDTLRVCLNEFAIRANEFCSTQFYQRFLALDGVIDPLALASSGKVIACRATIPRKSDKDVSNALQEQTGVLYSPIRMKRHACSVTVQVKDQAPDQWRHALTLAPDQSEPRNGPRALPG